MSSIGPATGPFGGGFEVDPDVDPDAASHSTGSTAPGDMAADARRRLAGEGGVHSDPGVRVDVGGGGSVPTLAPGGTGSAAGAADLLASLRPGGGSASAGVAATIRTDGSARPNEDAAAVSLGVGVRGAVATDNRGLDHVGGVMADGARIYDAANTAYDEIQTQLSTLQDSPQLARMQELIATATQRELTDAEVAEARQIATALEQDLRRAHDLLNRMPAIFDDMEGLIGRMGDGLLQGRGGATAAGYTEESIAVRTPSLRLGDHRLDLGIGIHAMQPLNAPQALRDELSGFDDLVAIQSSMVAARGYVHITATGLDALNGALSGIRDDLGALTDAVDRSAGIMGDVADDTRGQLDDATRLALEAAAAAQEMSSRGESLEDRVDALSGQVRFEVSGGATVDQATGATGLGLDELSVRWRWSPNQSFELAVRAYMENVAGYLKGQRDTLGIDDTGSLEHLGTETRNVYETFFPRTFGADVGLSMRRDSTTRTDLLAGVATNGDAVSAHLGLVQHLGRRVILHLGAVSPDVTRGGDMTLVPGGGLRLNLGPSARPDRVSLGLDGGAAIDFGNAGGPRLSGGHAGLTFRINF